MRQLNRNSDGSAVISSMDQINCRYNGAIEGVGKGVGNMGGHGSVG